MENRKTLIELKNVRKSFDGKTNVIEDVSLKIMEGEFVTLLGPSGCGKTTILRMIGGFDKPTEGEILDSQINIFAYTAKIAVNIQIANSHYR